MKNIYRYSLIVLSSLAILGCSEDFLEVDPRENIAEEDRDENFTPEDFVTGVYGMFTDYVYAFAYLGVTEIISDNADKGSSTTDTGGDKDVLDALTFTSSATSVNETWEHWYKTIGRANYAIAFAEEEGGENSERLIAEAKFLRAYTYFFLVRAFGDVTIQGQVEFVDGEPVVDPEVNLANRNTQEEVYEYIEQDLRDAVDVLPVKSAYAADDLGRATSGAAQALLSKVHLYQEEWSDALQHANAVINSGEYELEENYEDIWREYSENGSESIFEIQGRGEPIAHGVAQYSQTQAPRSDGTINGWGFNVPSENLVEAFDAEGDVIRRDATIIFRGETLWDGMEISNSAANPRYNEKAYSSSNLGDADGDKNIRALRLGEIYLIKAEAAAQTGDTETAMEALNVIRERVDLDPVDGLGQQELIEAIWNERRLELAFEHDRWFDLTRTGQAPEAMAEDGKEFQERHWLFPIPNNQLIQTPDMEQNPGW